MRPSSSPSERLTPDAGHPDGGGLFDGVLAAGPVRDAVGDPAWLQAMLDVEAALARAVDAPPDLAGEIADACRADRFDIAALGRDAAGSGNPVVPLVRALRGAVSPAAARYVHHGATSQDILDSAAMLVARRALDLIVADLSTAASAAATLAQNHRDTPVAARTLLQQALPTTFGLVAAGWLTMLDGTAQRLAEVRDHRLAVQLGGAAGTLAALTPSPAPSPAPVIEASPKSLERLEGRPDHAGASRGAGEVVARMAAELGLSEPLLPWHTDRTRIADLAGALGTAAGAVTKIARDVVLYAQTEVGELAEGRPGDSSTLPHKQNPVAAVAAIACAAQAPGLVATLLGAMAHEHQRAAGAWHAEWQPLTELLRTAGSAAHWLARCLTHLRVDADRMRANLDATGDWLLAERISGALALRIGATEAHELVRAAVASGRPLREAFAEHFSPAELTVLLDPASYLGSAGPLTDRAIKAHRDTR